MNVLTPISNLLGASSIIAIVTILTGLTVSLICWRRSSLMGTTLLAPWRWTLIVVPMMALPELLQGLGLMLFAKSDWPSSTFLELLRHTAAVSTLCPMMALLGAKRPQDRGWQLIVVSFWAVLCLPAFQAELFVGRAATLDSIWTIFLVVILAVGLLNHLFTRFALAAMLISLGQLALFAPRLPLLRDWQRAELPLIAMLLFAAAAAAVQFWPSRHMVLGWDLVWLDFRDRYGLLWGLRIGERLNVAGKLYHWPLIATWRGFRMADSAAAQKEMSKLPERLPKEFSRSYRMLLRRFVSTAWIRQRLPRD